MADSPIAAAAAWYAALLVFGVAGLLPSALLFQSLGSRGVFLARPLALALTALATWLGVRAGVPYGTPVVLGGLGLLLAWGAVIAVRRYDLVDDLRARWRQIAVAEGVFLAIFLVIAFARSLAPAALGTEKPADLMFLTAVHEATSFPPADPWLSGERLSYYHLGQVEMDAVARLSGNPPSVAFNLATATAGAAAGVAALGIALDVLARGSRRARIAAGMAAVAGLLLVAPLVGPVQVLAAHGFGGEGAWGWLGIEGVPPQRTVWWWPTSRVIPGAIDEYPAFTIVLGDPHAHLFALPLGIAALGLALATFAGAPSWRDWLREPERWALASGLFAALAMTNSWDVITFGALWFGAGWWAASRSDGALVGAARAVQWIVPAVVLAIVLAAPFLRTLDPNPIGLAPVRGEFTDLGRGALLWLPLLLPAIVAIAVLRPRLPRSFEGVALALMAALVAWIAWLLATGGAAEGRDRSWGWFTLAALVGAIAWCLAAARDDDERDHDEDHRDGGDRALASALALLGGGLLILFVTELVMSDDAFPGRMNTVFKFWFHAWALFAIAGAALLGVALDRLSVRDRGNRARSIGVFALVGICGAVWIATMATGPMMARERAGEGQERGLDALAYLDRADPGLAAAVAWARTHLDPESDVMAQAIGEAYSTGNRLASASAVPTLLAWPGHERQWRGEIGEDARRAAVEAIYAGTPEEAAVAVRDWHVTHVFVGREERAAYGLGVDGRFEGWPVAFASGDAVIFVVPAVGAS